MHRGDLQFDLSPDDQELFLTEVDELIQLVEESLVELERAPDDKALLNEIFRAAHTIKGSSATIGHTRMAALTHAMETRLDDLRKGTASVTPQLIEAVLDALDVLRLLRDEVETRTPADVDVEVAATAVQGRSARRQSGTDQTRSATVADEVATSALTATHRLVITLEQGPWMAVRALQVLLALGEHGTVVSSEPSAAEIERENAQLGQHLVVLLTSAASDEVLLNGLAAVPELGATFVEVVKPAPAVALEDPGVIAAPVVTAAARPAAKTMRIDVARLDALLNLVGELVIDRTRLVQLGSALVNQFGDDRSLVDLQQTSVHIGRIIDELQEQVIKSRMLPVESVFKRLPRVVRDIASKQGKQIDVVVEGKDTELDRVVIEEIGDPLVHLIRNAVDHGIETPERRVAAGKPARGTLRLTARHADSFILVSLEDDGNGVNLEAVKRKAVERGVIAADQADRISDQQALDLIFSPGLSTAESLSEVSGRGVGMDVVRANVEKINGSVGVQTRRGRGTIFTIRLPLTLAIVHALLVRVASGIYALPIHAVAETLRVEAHSIYQVNHRQAVLLRDSVLPLVSMRHVFGVAGDRTQARGDDGYRLVVAVHTTASRQVGMIVDELVGEQEIVIKPLGTLVGDIPGVTGAAILDDGTVALIVDVAAWIDQAMSESTTIASSAVERHAA